MNKIRLFLFPMLLVGYVTGYAQIASEFDGKVKIKQLEVDNTSDSLVVKLPDGTLGLRDAGSISSFQVLTISNDTIFLENGGFIKLPPGFDGAFSSLSGIPAGLSDGDDDTQLSDGDITALGYIKSADDADADPTNEIQDLSPYQTIAGTSTWDKDASDDFDGAFSSLSGIPAGLSDGDDDTQLSDGEITALGYIKSADDADADPTNEIQDLSPYQTIASTSTWDKDASDDFDGAFSSLSGIPAGLSDGDDDTQLSDGEITSLGYIKSADDADADPTNEIELPTGGTNGQVLRTNGSGSYTWTNQSYLPPGNYRKHIRGSVFVGLNNSDVSGCSSAGETRTESPASYPCLLVASTNNNRETYHAMLDLPDSTLITRIVVHCRESDPNGYIEGVVRRTNISSGSDFISPTFGGTWQTSGISDIDVVSFDLYTDSDPPHVVDNSEAYHIALGMKYSGSGAFWVHEVEIFYTIQ